MIDQQEREGKVLTYHFGLALSPEESVLAKVTENDCLSLKDATIDVDIIDWNAK